LEGATCNRKRRPNQDRRQDARESQLHDNGGCPCALDQGKDINAEELTRKDADHIARRDRNRTEPDRKHRNSSQQQCAANE
jgi:hypothetical protein